MTSNKRDKPPSPWPPSPCEQGPGKTCVYYTFLEVKECLVCTDNSQTQFCGCLITWNDSWLNWSPATKWGRVRCVSNEPWFLKQSKVFLVQLDRRGLTKGSAVDGRVNGFMMLSIHWMRGRGVSRLIAGPFLSPYTHLHPVHPTPTLDNPWLIKLPLLAGVLLTPSSKLKPIICSIRDHPTPFSLSPVFDGVLWSAVINCLDLIRLINISATTGERTNCVKDQIPREIFKVWKEVK